MASPISIFAPAKVNLFLAVTGRRADGFHDLVSVAAQLDFGDTLRLEPAPAFSLTCSDPELPVDESNLILKAARAFAAAASWTGGAAIAVEKRIPVGAGLGGGSSDAVATMRALNQIVPPGKQLEPHRLAALAAQLGSDCSLFLHARPVVMRGRGETITPLPEEAAARLRGRRLLWFKPGFGISTPWSYARLAAGAPASYCPPAVAEARLKEWIEDPAEALLFNNMEPPAFAKFVALPALFRVLEEKFGVQPRMSGSGSACFVLVNDGDDLGPMMATIRDAWGDSAFVTESRLT